MSLLYRFAKLPDRGNTHIFTFVVTKSVTRDLHRDVTSKEFVYGYQKWAITFSRTEKVLGVYLVWRNPSEGMRVFVDFSFTLLNREHFSANETFSGRQVKFSFDSPAQGNRRYVPVQDLHTRNFADRNGEFQLELSIGNIRTVFEVDLRMPPLNYHLNSYKGGSTCRPHSHPKIETTFFSFGGFDWNVAVYPNGREGSGDDQQRLLVYLNRLTGFDHQCRVRYMMVLGEGERRIDSGLLDDISDTDGKSYGWAPRIRLGELVLRGLLRIHLEMVTANTLSEVSLVPNTTALVLGGTMSPLMSSTSPPSQCFDRDKQMWTLEADTHSETLRVRLSYKDVHNVPRNHLRYVSWSSYLLRYNSKSGLLDPIAFTHAPFSHYYVQEETDDGIIMETDVTVKEIRDPTSFYLNEKQAVRVQIEWGESYLLFQATYHKYDDVTRVHNFQMRKEIGALQAENYSLERQLFSYQKSLAYAASSTSHQSTTTASSAPITTQAVTRGHTPTPPGTTSGNPTGGNNPGLPDDPNYDSDSTNHHHHHHHHHHRPYLDRTVSTETEYA